MSKFNKCLVVDSSYTARSVISAARAFVIHYKGNAEIVEHHPEMFNMANPIHKFYKPSVIRVPKYVKTDLHKVPLTRENIYRRDNHQCVYCGDDNRRSLTLDHVVPQSKGGPNTWDNLVTACKKCNGEKSDLTLEEYGKEIPKPYRPHHLMLIKKIHDIPEEWKPYLLM